MKFSSIDPNRFFRAATIVTLSFLAAWGFYMVVAEVKPFWADEWRLIYNLKFKTHAELWGPLDFTQQFPRVYLQVLKTCNEWFDFNYHILRFPSYFIGLLTILVGYRVMNKLYGGASITRFLFVFIVVSSLTFTEYYVQVKQYTMELLLSVVAVWQLITLLELDTLPRLKMGRYVLLCASFLVVPYFSYTYPIAVAPVFLVVSLQGLGLLKSEADTSRKRRVLLLQGLPVVMGVASIGMFYSIDVRNLMGDQQMHNYWSYRLLGGDPGVGHNALKFWDFFAQMGSGLLYEILFGLVGLCAFGYSAMGAIRQRYTEGSDTAVFVRLYALLLVVLALGLFVAGKLPIEPKFNAFTLPSLAILIVYLLDEMRASKRYGKPGTIILMALLLGLIGNVYVEPMVMLGMPQYPKRMEVYHTTQKTIERAQASKIPILVTAGVAYPDEIGVINPYMAPISASAVLKTFPAYNVREALPVYAIDSMGAARAALEQLPAGVSEVLVFDGLQVQVLKR